MEEDWPAYEGDGIARGQCGGLLKGFSAGEPGRGGEAVTPCKQSVLHSVLPQPLHPVRPQ